MQRLPIIIVSNFFSLFHCKLWVRYNLWLKLQDRVCSRRLWTPLNSWSIMSTVSRNWMWFFCFLGPPGCSSYLTLILSPFHIRFFTGESWIATAVWWKMLSAIVTHSYSRHVWMKECVVNVLFRNVVYPFRDTCKIIAEGFLGQWRGPSTARVITEKEYVS